MRKLALLAVVGALSGCATPPPPVQTPDRYISDQDDAALRDMCEPDGCAFLPLPVFRKLMERLKQRGV